MEPVVLPVVGLCSVDMWSQHTQLPPNDGSWSEPYDRVETDSDAPWTPADGRGDAEQMVAVGVMLIVVAFRVSARMVGRWDGTGRKNQRGRRVGTRRPRER